MCASWTAVVSADSLGSRLSAKTGFSHFQDDFQVTGWATWCYGMRVPRAGKKGLPRLLTAHFLIQPEKLLTNGLDLKTFNRYVFCRPSKYVQNSF